MEQLSIFQQVVRALDDLYETMPVSSEHVLVIGTSTSEVLGERIGTAGTEDVAKDIFMAIENFQKKTNVQVAFQCCEHLNRALVVEQETANRYGFEIVSVIPSIKAGGSMSTYAFRHLKKPVVVEHIKADAGIDIGDTLIGMHLKHVAVPVRSQIKQIGSAHLTMAKTRPKYIGGERAVYKQKIDTTC